MRQDDAIPVRIGRVMEKASHRRFVTRCVNKDLVVGHNDWITAEGCRCNSPRGGSETNKGLAPAAIPDSFVRLCPAFAFIEPLFVLLDRFNVLGVKALKRLKQLPWIKALDVKVRLRADRTVRP